MSNSLISSPKYVKNMIRAGPNDVGGGAIPGGFFFTKKHKMPKGPFWHLGNSTTLVTTLVTVRTGAGANGIPSTGQDLKKIEPTQILRNFGSVFPYFCPERFVAIFLPLLLTLEKIKTDFRWGADKRVVTFLTTKLWLKMLQPSYPHPTENPF